MKTSGLKNVNVLTKAQYDSVVEPADDELWAVEVETYSDNNGNWYRVYPDGWCEQGGFVVYGSGWRTVNLFKPYVDDKYFVAGGSHQLDSSYSSNPLSISFRSKTTTSFSCAGHDDTSVNACSLTWEAKGYINK